MEHKNVQTMTKAQHLQKVAMAIRDNSYDGAKKWMLVSDSGCSMLFFETKDKAFEFMKEFKITDGKLYYLVDMGVVLKEEMKEVQDDNKLIAKTEFTPKENPEEIKLTKEEKLTLKGFLYEDLLTKSEYHYELKPNKRDSLETLMKNYFYWGDEHNDGYIPEEDGEGRLSAYLVQEFKKFLAIPVSIRY